jgi:hypothetical protein
VRFASAYGLLACGCNEVGHQAGKNLGNMQRLEWKGVFDWSSILNKSGNMGVAEVGRRCGLPPLVFVEAEVEGLLCF